MKFSNINILFSPNILKLTKNKTDEKKALPYLGLPIPESFRRRLVTGA
jgi:hypothetical protein